MKQAFSSWTALRRSWAGLRADLSLALQAPPTSANSGELPLGPGEHRLVLASGLVFAVLGLGIAHLYARNTFPSYQQRLAHVLLRQKMQPQANSKIYPVLIEQRIRSPKKSDQYRALAEFDAEGRGGITTEYGFHTLSNTDIFQAGRGGESSASGGPSRPEERRTDRQDSHGETSYDSANSRQDRKTPSRVSGNRGGRGRGMYLKVPANYRFKQHMALRYDGRSLTAIATESMPGAAYFRGMIRQIRETFAPPGQNYIYRDRFGYMINQAIQPQVVKVQFVINRNGLVTDVKRISSLGQEKVDQACIDVLRNKNFGKPPPEIFRHGNVFGINFVFPDLRRFR